MRLAGSYLRNRGLSSYETDGGVQDVLPVSLRAFEDLWVMLTGVSIAFTIVLALVGVLLFPVCLGGYPLAESRIVRKRSLVSVVRR
ncbi:jg8861 [Pararge aegeria aegeria]|uniref:Jg8861 protein n=1 Tax=Pararge aegeria aegeria TaxID=348720 RepID=A0A8S4R7Y5_9NEOP|nr:jg8861 [Pararge aegeria aegeria]